LLIIIIKKETRKDTECKENHKKIQLFWTQREEAEGCYHLWDNSVCLRGCPGLTSFRTQTGLSPPNWSENKKQAAPSAPSFAELLILSPPAPI